MNGHQEQDEVDGGKLGRILFQKGRHKSGDNVDSPVTKRIRNGSGPPKNGSPSSKRNSTGEKYLYILPTSCIDELCNTCKTCI